MNLFLLLFVFINAVLSTVSWEKHNTDCPCLQDRNYWRLHYNGTGEPWPSCAVTNQVAETTKICGISFYDALTTYNNVDYPFFILYETYVESILNACNFACIENRGLKALNSSLNLLNLCKMNAKNQSYYGQLMLQAEYDIRIGNLNCYHSSLCNPAPTPAPTPAPPVCCNVTCPSVVNITSPVDVNWGNAPPINVNWTDIPPVHCNNVKTCPNVNCTDLASTITESIVEELILLSQEKDVKLEDLERKLDLLLSKTSQPSHVKKIEPKKKKKCIVFRQNHSW